MVRRRPHSPSTPRAAGAAPRRQLPGVRVQLRLRLQLRPLQHQARLLERDPVPRPLRQRPQCQVVRGGARAPRASAAPGPSAWPRRDVEHGREQAAAQRQGRRAARPRHDLHGVPAARHRDEVLGGVQLPPARQPPQQARLDPGEHEPLPNNAASRAAFSHGVAVPRSTRSSASSRPSPPSRWSPRSGSR